MHEAGLDRYPKELGFLFQRADSKNKRAIDMTMSNLNLTHSDIFRWIHDVIPPSKEHPILHNVIRLAPKYFHLFWKHYPDAVFLCDKKERLSLHIALQRGSNWSQPSLALIGLNDPINRHEKDPVTGLCSFMSAAPGKSSDVKVIYYLLRRDPNAWEGFRVEK